MSDASSSAAPQAASPDAPAAKAKKPRRWRRRLTILLLVLIAITVALRVILAVALPSVLRKVAAKYDLNCEYERSELYLISGNVGVWHLTITPKSGTVPLLSADYLRGDVSALNLLRGKLVVYHVEGDGIDLAIDRDEHGEIPILKQFLASTPMGTGNAGSFAMPQDINLDPPLRIDSFRGNRVRAHLRDRSVTPPLDTVLDVNVRLTDFGSLKRATQFDLDMTAPPLLDMLRVDGQGTARGKSIDATLNVFARGVHPKPAAGYLAALGIRPSGDDISLRLRGSIKTKPTGSEPVGGTGPATRPTGMTGEIVLTDISAVSDGVEAAAVERLTLGIDELTPKRARFGKLQINNVRANARRTPDNAIRAAGFDLVGGGGQSAKPSTSATPLLPWSLAELDVRNVKAVVHDDIFVPPAQLAFAVDSATLKNFASDGTEMPTALAVQMSAPGLARSVRITGQATPLAEKKSIDVKILAEGVKLEAIRPYLDQVGIESRVKDGTFACDVRASLAQSPDGKVAADANVSAVKFTDGGAELLGLEKLTLSGLNIDPAANLVRVQDVDVVGPALSAGRDHAGTLGAVGFAQRTVPTASAAASVGASSAAAAAATTQPFPLLRRLRPPNIEIGQLTWRGLDVKFQDQAVTPPSSVALSETGVELTDVRIELDPKYPAASARPGKIRAWMSAPGIAGRIAVSGTIAQTQSALDLELNVTGQGLKAGPLSPYLRAMGIEPLLRDGSIQAHTSVALKRTTDGTISGDVAVSNVKYADAGQELAGVDSFTIRGATLATDRISVNEIAIDKPRGKFMRDRDGTFVAGGMRLLPVTTASTPTSPTSPASAATPSASPATQPSSTRSLPVLALNTLTITDAAIAWSDRAVARPVDATARADVKLEKIIVGRSSDPATLHLTLRVPQTMETLTASGNVWPVTDKPAAKLDIRAEGIREGWLASYLPPGVRINLVDGRFHVKLDAGMAPADGGGGGQQIRLAVSDFDYRDGAQGKPLLRFDSARVVAPRIDPAGKVIAVSEVSLGGLETDVTKASDGTIRALGLTLGRPPTTPRSSMARTTPPPTPAEQTAAAKIPPSAAKSAPPAPAPSTNVVELIAQERAPLPLVTLDKLDLNVRRASYTDQTRPADTSPVSLADVRVRNRKRIEVLGSDAASRPPAEIEVAGRIDPLVKNFRVVTIAAPFASQPTLQVNIEASGIRGEGVTALAPELNDLLDGKPLTDGQFRTQLEATARLSRRGSVQYDFDKPFDAEFTVRPLEFRASAEGPVLAGVEEIRAEGLHVDPQTGGVRVRTLEITKPLGNVYRDAEGLHVLGMILKETAPSATQPVAAAAPAHEPSLAQQRPQATPPPPKQSSPAPATTRPSAEMRIDRLVVSGIDFRVEDRTSTPPLLVPLTSLEVEVRDLSNMAMYDAGANAIRFNVVAGAGKVPLTGKGERDLFSEVTANGSLALYPQPRGWAKTSVSGFEMLALEGPAKAQEVKIGGGVFDGTVDLRFADDGSLDTRSRLALTDLKLSEPPNGPIQSTLKLPAPVNGVILILQDPSGAITIPLHVPLKQGEVSTSALLASASGAFLQIVGTAMASSPLKIAGGVTNIMGVGPQKKEPGAQDGGFVAFAPADAQLTGDTQMKLGVMAERLRRESKLELTLKHDLGHADLERAAVLANPSPDECLALAEQIRSRKQQLLESRASLAGEARARLASGGGASADPSLAKLREVDRELAAAEDALDRVYDLLRPGADRQADRRTRAAALQIAQARLEVVRAALLASGIPNLDQRVRITHAQFTDPQEGQADGKVTFTLLEKKKP